MRYNSKNLYFPLFYLDFLDVYVRVEKDLANRCIDMVLLYIEAFIGAGKGLSSS